jgi:hypothetical protein
VTVRRYAVISDLQCPYQNQRAVDSVCNFIADWKPDVLLNVGDDTDSPEPSRWNRGLAGEYAGTLQRGLDDTHRVHQMFRQALGKGKPYHVMRSNHADRVETYVRKYAPALASLRDLRIEQLLRYEDVGVQYHRQVWEFLPGWVLAHGDEAGLSQQPGGTAMGLSRRLGKSVLCGHTHRMGMQHETRGLNGRTSTIVGMEVGHLMDIRKASYLKTGTANWLSGFATLQVESNKVYPSLHVVQPDGRFVAFGKTFRP